MVSTDPPFCNVCKTYFHNTDHGTAECACPRTYIYFPFDSSRFDRGYYEALMEEMKKFIKEQVEYLAKNRLFPCGVIGNTSDFESEIAGPSPAGGATKINGENI